jgi:TP901 family phage tail tape measure protein
MSKEFGALTAQVTALNAQLAKTMDTSLAVDPRGYDRLAKAAALNSSTFRKAAASTGMFEVQQVRLNSATDEYVKKLNAQKMSFRELMRTRKIAHAAFREQLAMESMLIKKAPSGTTTNKEVFDVVTPKRYDEALNTAGRRLSWFNEQLRSGANQMVNWGKNTQWAGRQLMVGFTIPLAAFGAAAGVMAYQVDQAMTRVRKVYNTTADSTSADTRDIAAVNAELAALTTTSIKTATEAAKAYGAAGRDTLEVMGNLAATGLAGSKLQESTKEVMRIAMLGEVDTSVATDATIALQSVFRDTIKTSQDLTDAFNYMNAVENATSLTTADFAEAIPVAASAVRAWGGDVKELGILLTAMRENGIQASEGANALKATMQRLARPSKQVREEWQALTNTDITQITENADSLSDVFTQIFHATENLSDASKRKAFAGLFGSYQVSKMMALTKGMGELEAGVGQVSAAYKLAGQDASDWATIAENEAKQAAESISGQFKRAFETLKLELSTFGEPFVVVATKILKAITGIMEAFNNAPSIVKWGVAIAAVIAGIAGPIVMLTGLFANLFGNALKTTGFMLAQFNKLLGVMGVLPREARINALAAELMEKGYQSQTKAVKGLTVELEKLVAAQAAANQSSAGLVANAANVRKSKALIERERRQAEHDNFVATMNRNYGVRQTNGKIAYRGLVNGRDTALSNAEVMRRTQADIAEEQRMIAASAKTTAAATAQTRRNLTGAAVAGGALAAGMVLTMTNSNETANEIGNMLIMGSLVVPAAIELAKVMKEVFKATTLTLIAEKAGLAVTRTKILLQTAFYRTSIAVSKAQLAWNAAAASGAGILGRMGAFLTTFANPLTLAVGAVAAIGVGLYAWKRHLDKIEQKQTELHHNINSMVDAWAEKVGLVRKEYEKVANIQGGIAKQDKYKTYLDAYNDGDLKKNRDAFASNDITESQRVTAARAQFARMVRDYGMSMDDAALSLQAMYESAGLSIFDAQQVVRDLKDEFGANLDGLDVMQIQAELTFQPGQTDETAHEMRTELGRAFAQEYSQASPGPESQALLNYFQQLINTTWQSAWDNLANSSNAETQALVERMKAAGIDGPEALRQGIEQAGSVTAFANQFTAPGEFTQFADILTNEVNPAITATTSIMGGLTGPRSPFSDIPSNVNNLNQLANSAEGLRVIAQGFDTDKMKEYLNILANPPRQEVLANILPQATELEKMLYMANDQERIAYANAILLGQGYEQINTRAELLNFLAGDLPDKIDGATAATRGLSAGMAAVAANLGQIGQQAMEATQQMVADDYTGMMETIYDKDVENTTTFWDNKVKQVGDAGERARAALDKAWEHKNDAAEKYWEHRIDLVDKAIKAEEDAEAKREKMFDAEVARIEKLNDLANANIDFNVALNQGKLDEAAKLRNDMEAQTSTEAITRARDEMSNASEKRVDKLNKRKDRLEKQKEAAMKAMQAEEEAQKAHLERMTQARQDAVEKQRDIEVKAAEERRDANKAELEAMIESFMAGTATSRKELRKRFEDAGLDYELFEKNVIHKRADSWSKYIGDKLHTELQKSADAIRQDAMWEQMGKDGLALMARGMGFSGQQGLMHFLKTGEIKAFHENMPATASTAQQNKNENMLGGVHHEGGTVGSAKNSRKGVAKNYKGLHPSETMVMAQKGEFIVNKRAAAKHGDLLNAVNSDEYDRINRIKNGKGGLGAGMGPMPFFAAAFTRAMMTKTNEKLAEAVTNKKAALAASAAGSYTGAYGTLGAGVYGNTSFSEGQVANARLIANVGKNMGMSVRDIEIGIMTAITESSLINNPGGDRDSVGLFQQRPSQGWGTYAQVSNPTYAATKFFSVLKGITDRDTMAPWLAAQAVQRSAYSDGSNYQQYWDEATAMFNSMKATPEATGIPGGPTYAPGPGGLHRAAIPGKGWSTPHDYLNQLRSPLYAIGDGNVSLTTYPPSAGSGEHPNAYPRGYGSYGVLATLRTNNGTEVKYAHLWPGSVQTGPVKGGQQIALSAATGNASGPHTHFEVNGSTNAQGIFAAMGIGLRKGAEYVRFDNTLANLHKGESVLTKDITNKMRQGVDQFANGGGMGDTINVYPSEGMDEEALANKVVRKLDKRARRKPVTRTVGSR